jgi:hypothetical protein
MEEGEIINKIEKGGGDEEGVVERGFGNKGF